MGSVHTEVSIAKPVDEVWKVAGSFGGLEKYFPGIESCRVEGGSRFLKMGQMEIQEDLESRDDATHTLIYGIAGGPVPVTKHRTVVTVTPDGDGSKVTFDCEFEPDDLQAIFEPTYQGAVTALKTYLES